MDDSKKGWSVTGQSEQVTPIREAVIIAGGRGTRLRRATPAIPKVLVPIAGRPLVDHILSELADYGVDKVYFLVGHLADQVEAHVGNGERFGVECMHVHETEPLGTAGGLTALGPLIQSDFFAIYGDLVFKLDLARLAAFHRRHQSAATLVAHPNDHPQDSDLLEVMDGGQIRSFLPAKSRPAGYYRNLVSAAFYVLHPQIFKHIREATKQDFVRDVFPRLLKSGGHVFAYRTTEYVKDMGTPVRLEIVRNAWANGQVAARHWSRPRPAAFLDRDGVINREVDELVSSEQLELIPGSARAIRALNEAGWLVVVVTNQPMLAKRKMSDEMLAHIHAKLDTLLGQEGAFIDALYYCPHHPEVGWSGEVPALKISCRCRKPAPGMLEQAASELPIDLRKSLVIGDSWRDMLAARAMGLPALGVRTGYGCRTDDPSAEPDVHFDNLLQAAHFLTEPDPVADRLMAWVEERLSLADGRFVVLIGGSPRAGKSTLSHRLVRQLVAQGHSALHVKLDMWLKPLNERDEAGPATARFRLDEAQQGLRRLATGDCVNVRPYLRHNRQLSNRPVELDGRGVRVFVVDGTCALELTPPDGCSGLRVFVDAPTDLLRQRFETLGHWRGLSRAELAHTWQHRVLPELKLLRGLASTSDCRLTLGNQMESLALKGAT
ncbi:MAG: hypothetical protein A2289_19440 [Deltaproteobacteria bacterium RIFOXYA12_FULL_58_15]|nr:MAG: hypothetical protein A2289_19440 [Deltaproteobacteria bacterium RIFOXYA12_FULL_58_15]